MGDEIKTGSGESGQPNTADPQVMAQLQKALKNRTSLAPMSINPKMGRMSMGQEIGTNLLNMFIPQVGTALQNHIKQSKEQQVNQLSNMFMVLHNAWEEAQSLTDNDQDKAKQMFEKDPRVTAVLGDKKNQKLIAKAWGVDLMNPEKTQNNVAFQGMKRFMDLKQAKGQIDSAKGMLDHIKRQGQGAAQTQGAAQGQPQQQAQGQPNPAEQFLNKWPKETKQPTMADVEKAAQTVKAVVSAQAEAEPKTEWQGWYKSYKAEHDGETPSSSAIVAHQENIRLKPIDQLSLQAIQQAESGDAEGAKQTMDLANSLFKATHSEPKENEISLIGKALGGNKKAKDILDFKHQRDVDLRLAYGRGRAMYILKNFVFDDGTTRTMSEAQYIDGMRSGEFAGRGIVMMGQLTTDQVGTMQRAQTAIGPKNTKFYETGALKGLYDNVDVFDDDKTRAIFAKVLGRTDKGGDTETFLHNVVDQLAQEHLDAKGLRALAYTNRLREALGTMRKAGYLPSTEASQKLMYSLIPGGVTASAAQARIQLDMVSQEVENMVDIPLMPHAPKAKDDKEGGKKKADF